MNKLSLELLLNEEDSFALLAMYGTRDSYFEALDTNIQLRIRTNQINLGILAIEINTVFKFERFDDVFTNVRFLLNTIILKLLVG